MVEQDQSKCGFTYFTNSLWLGKKEGAALRAAPSEVYRLYRVYRVYRFYSFYLTISFFTILALSAVMRTK